MPNSLAREIGFKVGPVLLEGLVKHYFDRLKKDLKPGVPLRQEDILYDEAFRIVKAFLNASSLHTVEDLQSFCNTRTPSPPWVHVVRVIVPMSSCDEAAVYLIKALGGETVARHTVGGTKWWQVRGIDGVDGQWITAKKDWREAKRRYKMEQHQPKHSSATPGSDNIKHTDTGVYDRAMDELRCILYLHGGGYYFGSVDQERYSIQRHARKINGRVFAINYRLAPQYPFPCAIQDALAAYLFLIRPPPGASHRPVRPEHILIMGDSAGGGLSIALLQVIRDTGLPTPAGGVLISPWCDLTHSFLSVHTNTETDIIPDTGLSFHKPSILWPPPSQEVSSRVHASLRSRIRKTFHSEERKVLSPIDASVSECGLGHENMPVNVGATTPIPPEDSINCQRIKLTTGQGEELEINEQVHFYTQNSMLSHPLVSPALSYLGGLPPLYFVASDKEVLRDEIIYTAHKAANPGKYPMRENIRALYPPVAKITECKPTSVHLQVYDDAAHILPVLFSFTTPAKYCFRAIASFSKFVTGIDPTPHSPTSDSSSWFSPSTNTPPVGQQSLFASMPSLASSFIHISAKAAREIPKTQENVRPPTPPLLVERSKSLKRAISLKIKRASSIMRRHSDFDSRPRQSNSVEPPVHQAASSAASTTSSDVGGPRFSSSTSKEPQQLTAGQFSIYMDIPDHTTWNRMIRERVSTQGVIRPLEPEKELDAFQVPSEIIGTVSERAMRRFLTGRAAFDKKFSHTIKSVEKKRRHHLERAKEDTNKRMELLERSFQEDEQSPTSSHKKQRVQEGLMSSPGLGWAWALDEGEEPPPSSLAARRDTAEARRLAEIANQAILGDDHTMSANNLWSVIISFLTVTPGKSTHVFNKSPYEKQEMHENSDLNTPSSIAENRKSKLSRFMLWDSASSKDSS